MFDLRYHVASLAAVFVALAVGIVIGVAIVSRTDVRDQTLRVRQSEIDSLTKQVEAANARAKSATEARSTSDELMKNAYPSLMTDRLADKGFAVVFLGRIDPGLRSEIEETLTDASSGPPVRLTSLDLPVDAGEISSSLAADPLLAAYGGQGRLGDLGEALGKELIEGGETPLWETLSGDLVAERTGALSDPVNGVIIVRSWLPTDTNDPDEIAVNQDSADLIDGLTKGVTSQGLPVIGVESLGADIAAIEFFTDAGVSTVNNLDELAGHVSLAVLLGGGDPGHYGVGAEAPDGVSPPIPPVPTATVAGG
jgi:hypothetical protein